MTLYLEIAKVNAPISPDHKPVVIMKWMTFNNPLMNSIKRLGNFKKQTSNF